MIHCISDNGRKGSFRHVVADVLIVKDNTILLLKRAPGRLCAGKYALVGGYLERDETIVEGACREILEETGYLVTITSLLRIKDNPDRPQEDTQNIAFVLIATPKEKIQEADNESTEQRWFSFDNLPAKESFAFDHYEDIQLYLKNKDKKLPLPLF